MNESVKTKLYQYLDKHYYDQLEFLDNNNPKKMIIFFSGKSGVGKSTLARYLSKELGAIHLENDKVRILIQDFFNNNIKKDDRNQLMWDYANYVNDKLAKKSPNQLWVRDAMIDRFYEYFWEYCDKNSITRFVISFQLSEKLTAQQIVNRVDKQHVNVKNLLGDLGKKQIAWRTDFLQHNTPDYVFTDKNHGQFVEVLQLIKKRYQKL